MTSEPDFDRYLQPPEEARCDECGRTPDRCDCADDPDRERDVREDR